MQKVIITEKILYIEYFHLASIVLDKYGRSGDTGLFYKPSKIGVFKAVARQYLHTKLIGFRISNTTNKSCLSLMKDGLSIEY